MGSSAVHVCFFLLAMVALRSGASPQLMGSTQTVPTQMEERKVVSTVRSFNRTTHQTTTVRQERGPDRVTNVSELELGTLARDLDEHSVIGPSGSLSERSVRTQDVRRLQHSDGSRVDLLESVGAGRSDARSRSNIFGDTNATLQLRLGEVNRSERVDGGGERPLISADLLTANGSRCDECRTPTQLDVSVYRLRPTSLRSERESSVVGQAIARERDDNGSLGADTGSDSGRLDFGQTGIGTSARTSDTVIGSSELQPVTTSDSLSATAGERRPFSIGIPRRQPNSTAINNRTSFLEPALGGRRLNPRRDVSGDLGATERCRDDCCALTDIHARCTCFQIRLASDACIIQHLP